MRSAECGVLSGERRDAHDLPGQTPHSALRIMFSEMPHLYLHVPFCARRCSYCDFSIAVRKRVPAREYVDAVLRELDWLRNSPGWVNPGATPRGTRWGNAEPPTQVNGADPGLDTLYLGGGTPSLLPADALATLLTILRDAFHGTPSLDAVEVTLEANPEDVTPDNAVAWRRAGVNRVSLGAQSFDDRVLRWMHRSHDAARIGDAVGILRRAGITNVSLDLIFALPAELGRDWGPYLGCGPAAHSFDGRARRWNLAAWEAYRRAVAAGRSPIESEEVLTAEQRELERIYLSLRTDEGLPLPPSAATGRESFRALYRLLPPLVDRGWVEVRGERVVCTPEGWLRLDALVNDLTGRHATA